MFGTWFLALGICGLSTGAASGGHLRAGVINGARGSRFAASWRRGAESDWRLPSAHQLFIAGFFGLLMLGLERFT